MLMDLISVYQDYWVMKELFFFSANAIHIRQILIEYSIFYILPYRIITIGKKEEKMEAKQNRPIYPAT